MMHAGHRAYKKVIKVPVIRGVAASRKRKESRRVAESFAVGRMCYYIKESIIFFP